MLPTFLVFHMDFVSYKKVFVKYFSFGRILKLFLNTKNVIPKSLSLNLTGPLLRSFVIKKIPS